MNAKKRIKSRRRRMAKVQGTKMTRNLITVFAVFAVCGAMGIAGLLGIEIFADKATAANEIVNKQVIVHSGDSLWSIASENIEQGKSVRSYVYEIAELNNIKDSKIYAGQTILVPVIRG